jgi:hypothetical protein
MYTNETQQLYRPNADLTITIVTNSRGYAFFYSGFRIVHVVAAKYFDNVDSMTKNWDALVSALRSLTSKDKDALLKTARLGQRTIKFVVRSANTRFVDTINEFDDLDNVEPLREFIKGHLLDRVEGYRKDLDFDIEAEFINPEHITFKRCYSYLLRTLDIPQQDPRSEHTMPAHFSTSDQRYLKAFIPVEAATAPTPKEFS